MTILFLNLSFFAYAGNTNEKPLSEAAVDRACSRLLSQLSGTSISDDAIRAFISANDVGHGNLRFRLAVMKGVVSGNQRIVFFLGENHKSGPESYHVGNKVIDLFRNIGTEDLADTLKKNRSWGSKLKGYIAPHLPGPRRGSAIIRAAARRNEAGKNIFGLEVNHRLSKSDHMQALLEDWKTLAKFGATIGAWGAIVKLAAATGLVVASPELSSILPSLHSSMAIVSISLLFYLYLLRNSVMKEREFSEISTNPAASTLGMYSYYLRSSQENIDVLQRRDQTMANEIMAQFEREPDMPYMLVMTGKAHVPGIMRLLRAHQFKHIPLNLRAEAAKEGGQDQAAE